MASHSSTTSKFRQELVGPTDSFCHVVGLSSEQGKKRNGSAAIVRLVPQPAAAASTAAAEAAAAVVNNDDDRRAAVCTDGFPGPISIKLGNLKIINHHDACKKLSVGVGRGTLLDSNFDCVIVDETADAAAAAGMVGGGVPTSIPYRSGLSGGAPRCRGNLLAVQTGIDKGVLMVGMPPKKNDKKNNKKKKSSASASSSSSLPVIILLLTDLNVSRALNRLACGDTTVQLASSSSALNQQLKRIIKSGLFSSSSSSAGGGDHSNANILIKFNPHRISPDDGFCKDENSVQGLRRYAAALDGCYHIYPCALKQYLDALEVRFAARSSTNPSNIICGQDIYLDTGVDEAIVYAQNALALGEADRLEPKILAQVDPQAFWSAVLWLDDFINVLVQAKTVSSSSSNSNSNNIINEYDKLLHEWELIRKGKVASRRLLEDLVEKMDSSDKILLKGPLENWGLAVGCSEDLHLRVATDHALAALHLMQKSLAARGIRNVSISYQLVDYYKGTEMDMVMAGLKKLQELVRQREASTGGEPIGMDEYDRLYNKSMKAAGFDRYSDYRKPGALEECGHCGKRSKTKLMECTRCAGAAYCNESCQRADWKNHRNGCSRVIVQLEKQMKETAFLGGTKVRAELSTPASMPSSPCILCEVSGTGSMAILWNQPGISSIFFPPFDPSLSAAKSEMTVIATQRPEQIQRDATIRFLTFSHLSPRLRFVITCGPLPDLDVAKSSLDAALASVDGDVGKLRFDIVQFTALEWAAKKGNMEIVKWLCTDDRTKALVSIGSPVGWACYTNKIDIARYLVTSCGADPGKTDVVLFNNLPPLMLAAQNGHAAAMKYLVDECGQDIRMLDGAGRDVIENIRDAINWRECPGNVECHQWAKQKLRRVGQR
jgi:MYND finger/Ankyrin repeats (3 copies)